jgi:hypothetical protein
MNAPLKVVGVAGPRKDAPDKVTGAGRYAVDIALPGMLHAKVLRSPHAHARVVSIDARRAAEAPGVPAWRRPTVISSRTSRSWRWTACAMSATRWPRSPPIPRPRRRRRSG